MLLPKSQEAQDLFKEWQLSRSLQKEIVHIFKILMAYAVEWSVLQFTQEGHQEQDIFTE